MQRLYKLIRFEYKYLVRISVVAQQLFAAFATTFEIDFLWRPGWWPDAKRRTTSQCWRCGWFQHDSNVVWLMLLVGNRKAILINMEIECCGYLNKICVSAWNYKVVFFKWKYIIYTYTDDHSYKMYVCIYCKS